MSTASVFTSINSSPAAPKLSPPSETAEKGRRSRSGCFTCRLRRKKCEEGKPTYTTVSIWLTQFYGFSPRGIGYFYFFGIIGPLIGWFAGHWLHDTVGRLYAHRHDGHIDPEARLIIAYPATALLFVAVIVIGFALEHQWHYMVLAVFSAVQTVGVMIVTTAINAYLLDCYPEGSGEVGAWVTASRNWSGFMATFIQIEWVKSAGPATAFGAQAGITGASIIILVILQLYGKRLRKWQGRMVFSKQSKVL